MMKLAMVSSRRITTAVVQNFDFLTKHKKKGRRWVTKEQYIRYFMMCYNMLFPDNGMSEGEQRESLAVRWKSLCSSCLEPALRLIQVRIPITSSFHRKSG